MDRCEVAVVGAGIIGAAIAFECASRGASVVVLEREAPGGSTSRMAAGMLAPGSEAQRDGPFFALGRRSLRMWPRLAQRLLDESGIDCELSLCGLLRVAFDPAQAAAVATAVSWQRDRGVDCTLLDGDAAAEVEPALNAVTAAALYREEGHVRGDRSVDALLTAARRNGADIRVGLGVRGSDGGGALRLDDGSSLTAAAVAVCAGARGGEVVRSLGGPPLPIGPVRGQLIALHGAAAPAHVVYGDGCGYALTRADGTVVVGATEEVGSFDTTPDAATSGHLLEQALRLLGTEQPSLLGAWAGLRPHAPDGLPVLGEVGGRGATRLMVAGGHHRNGVLLAPATADGMATLILDGRRAPEWEAFDPARFD